MPDLEIPMQLGTSVDELRARVAAMRPRDAFPLTTPGAGVRRPVKIDLPLGEQIIQRSERLDVGISDYMRGVLMIAVGAVEADMQDPLDLPGLRESREEARLAS